MKNLLRIWKYREMLLFLFWREVKVRYKQAAFGIAWSIITPAVQALVFFFVFGQIFKVASTEIPYLLLVFSGLTFWNFLASSISSATYSLTNNTALITKASFPREILVIATILGRIPDLLGSLIVLLILTVIFQNPPSLYSLYLLPLFIIEISLALGIGLFFSAINVYFRDISALVPLLLMVWLFLTPVVWELKSIPASLQLYAKLNPMTGVLEGIRSSLFLNKTPDFFALSLSLAITLIVVLAGFSLFKKLEPGFADTI